MVEEFEQRIGLTALREEETAVLEPKRQIVARREMMKADLFVVIDEDKGGAEALGLRLEDFLEVKVARLQRRREREEQEREVDKILGQRASVIRGGR